MENQNPEVPKDRDKFKNENPIPNSDSTEIFTQCGNDDLKTLLQTYILSIKSILKERSCALPFESLYQLSYTLSKSKHNTKIYFLIINEIKYHIESYRQNLLVELIGENFVEELCKFYQELNSSIKMIENSNSYFKVKYIEKYGYIPIKTRSRDIFSKLIFDDLRINKIFCDYLHEITKKFIARVPFNNDLFNNIVCILNEKFPTIFDSLISIPIIEILTCHYKNIVESLLKSNDFLCYINTAFSFIKKEEVPSKYDFKIMQQLLKPTIIEVMLVTQLGSLCELKRNDFVFLVENKCFFELENLYTIFCYNSNTKILFTKIFELKMVEFTKKLIKYHEIKNHFYQDIFSPTQASKLFQELEYIFRYCLHEDHNLIFILQQCYELYICHLQSFDCNVLTLLNSFLINKKLYNIFEIKNFFLSKLDFLLQISSKKFEILQKYQLFMSNRIISGKFSLPLEEEAFKKITPYCDNSYSKSIEKILEDLRYSEKFNRNFQKRNLSFFRYTCLPIDQCFPGEVEASFDVDFNVKILNYGFLFHLKHNNDGFFMPKQFEKMMDNKKNELKRDLPKKKFIYIPSLSTVELSLYIPGKNNEESEYNLTASFFQYLILELIYKHRKVSFEEILTQTRIPSKYLAHEIVLLTRTKKKYQIVLKEPPGSKIELNDIFLLNPNYYHHKKSINIHKDTDLIKETELDHVDQSQKFEIILVIKCRILFIIKTKKQMNIMEIKDEVKTSLSRFNITDKQIVGALKALVDEHYLAISGPNGDTFQPYEI